MPIPPRKNVVSPVDNPLRPQQEDIKEATQGGTTQGARGLVDLGRLPTDPSPVPNDGGSYVWTNTATGQTKVGIGGVAYVIAPVNAPQEDTGTGTDTVTTTSTDTLDGILLSLEDGTYIAVCQTNWDISSTGVGLLRFQFELDGSPVGEVWEFEDIGAAHEDTVTMVALVTVTSGPKDLKVRFWKTVAGGTATVDLASTTLIAFVPGGAGSGAAGVSDHGALTGLTDDDHTQYILADGSRVFTTHAVFEAASTAGVRLDLESGDLAIREGDDSAYAKLRALQYIIGAATTAGILLKVSVGQLLVREGDDSALAPIAALTFTAQGGGSDKLFDLTGGYQEIEEISAPGTPSVNKLRVYVKDDSGVSRLAAKGDDGTEFLIKAASATAQGLVELATTAETDTGTDTGRAVTPDGLAGSYAGTKSVSILVSDPNGDAITTGNGKASFLVPSALNGMNLVAVAAGLTTVSSSGAPNVMVRRNRRASATTRTDADMLSTALTIDASEFSSVDAATAAVINGSNDDVVTGDQIHIDIDGAGTGAKGLQVVLEFRLP